MAPFRIGLPAGFLKPDGAVAYPDCDLSPLRNDPRIALVQLNNGGVFAPGDVGDLDALIMLGGRFAKASAHSDHRLSLIARFGVGYDNVDLATCTESAIAVSITPDGVRRPVAVSVIAFLLALTGRMFEKDRLARMGPAGFAKKNEFIGYGLVGRTLGLVGIGNIGAETVRLAKPFDMTIIAHDPYADPALARELGIRLVALDEVFRQSDFISLHCPLNETTRHLVDARRIALMKPSAFLINTARGPIVDQKALTLALQEKRIRGAGLDVFDPEPPAADDALLTLDNVILAPHALCHTDQCFGAMGTSCIESVFSILAGKPPKTLVNRGVLENAAFKEKLAAYAKM